MQPFVNSVLEGEYDVPIYNPEPDTITVLDLGLNVGSFSIWANYRWKPRKIYGYEPVRRLYEMAERNLQDFKNIEVLNLAVRKEDGQGEIFLGKNNCGENSFFVRDEETHKKIILGKSVDTEKVECLSAKDLPQANVIKLDVEGCEKEILENIDNLDFDLILLEYHAKKFRREIDDLLENYTLYSASASSRDSGILKYIKDTPEFNYKLVNFNNRELEEMLSS